MRGQRSWVVTLLLKAEKIAPYEWVGMPEARRADAGAGEVTSLLRAWHGGDDEAYRRVSGLLYTELRQQAALFLRRQQAGDLLQTTALVARDVPASDRREPGRLAGSPSLPGRRRTDDAPGARRHRTRTACGPNAAEERRTCRLPPACRCEVRRCWIVALDAALDKLATLDARKVQVIELRFFAGLTVEETAQVLDVSPDTVARDWRMARTWLLRELDTGRART